MAEVRFSVRLQRLFFFVRFGHILMAISVAVVVLLSILLAGCSSYSTMTNVYILSLSYANATLQPPSTSGSHLSQTLNDLKGSSQLEVRAGYFGICVRQHGTVWFCSSDTDSITQQLGNENDPLNIIGMASKFRDDVLFSGLLFMGIILSFLALIMIPIVHRSYGYFTKAPSRAVTEVALSCVVVATLVCLVASLWQHVGSVGAASMAETANYGNVKSSIGIAAMIMAWISFALSFLSALGVYVLIQTIVVVNQTTDLSDDDPEDSRR